MSWIPELDVDIGSLFWTDGYGQLRTSTIQDLYRTVLVVMVYVWYSYCFRLLEQYTRTVRYRCVKIFLVRPSIVPWKNLKRRSPFILFLRGVGGSAWGFFRN